MRRQRGFTLMEILIAMALTTIVTASVLSIVRTQLMAFEQNDQVVRTQQNARAGLDFVESIVRRACGGISQGWLWVYTPTMQATSTPMACLRYFDGPTSINASSFTGTNANLPDALEVVYATGTMTAISAANGAAGASLTTTAPFVDVLDTCNFNVGDYAILTDKDYANPALFYISAVSGTGNCPRAGRLSFGTVSPAPTTAYLPVVSAYTGAASGTPVLKAATYSFYVAPSTVATYGSMLMIDSNGIASTGHTSYGTTYVQPAVEGVVDFQVAVGVDNNPTDGAITENTGSKSTDEWYGNSSSDAALPTPTSAAPWTTLKQVRLSLMVQSMNSYPGAGTTLSQGFEDRPLSSYPSVTPTPRYRAASIVVAPRAWNLAE
jgi:prepilin-type N-terminal cleavage/methylation domain-containing protein